MTFLARLATHCAVALMIASQGLGAQSHATPPADSAFVAVVQAIVADTTFLMHPPLSIDPRLVRVDGLAGTQAISFPALSPAALRARTIALQTLRVPIGDARLPVRCAGVMVPYSPQTYHRGCPHRRREVVSIDVPHAAIAAELPAGAALDAPQWVTSVVHASIGPEGVSYLVWGFVLTHDDLGWKAAKGKLLRFVE